MGFTQLKIRLDEELASRIKSKAAEEQKSVTQWVTDELEAVITNGPHGDLAHDYAVVKKALLAYIMGTIDFPGSTPLEKVKNTAAYLAIHNDPDVSEMIDRAEEAEAMAEGFRQGSLGYIGGDPE